MKKIEKISIAEISFALDSDAYISLKQYLDSLHKYYDKDPDGGEIIADIEARIAELILNEQIYTKIVPKNLIDSIIAQLGTPEEIEELATEISGRPSSQESSMPRRLYRTPEGRICGGVCSGMAQFWNINAVWLRLLFLAPFILFIIAIPFDWNRIEGFFLGWTWVFIVIYVVLWMAIPMAKSPRHRLEMRGEKITPSSIRQNLQENVTTPSGKKAASVMAEIFAVVGRVFLFFIKFVVAVIGFALVIASVAIFVAIIVVLANPMSIGMCALSVASLAGMTILSPIMFTVLVLFCTMIPLFVLGMALLSLAFNWKPGRVFYTIFLAIWMLAMIFCSVVVVSNANYLREEFSRGKFSNDYNSNKDWHSNRNTKAAKELRDAFNEDLSGLNIDIAEDSLVVIVKKRRENAENDTLKVWKSDNDTKRIVIRRIDN